MTFEITLPLKLIRLEKVAAVDVPVFDPGGRDDYVAGSINPDVSVPVEYWIIGWLLIPPTLGESVLVLRIVRDGIVFPGQFKTSPVMGIRGNEFHTMNSIYRWEQIG